MRQTLAGRAASAAALAALITAVALFGTHAARSSDHQDAPATLNHPGVDLSDIYLFPSPQNPANAVLVMNVHPLIATGLGTTTFFEPNVLYQMHIDNSGAATPSNGMVVQFLFGSPSASQTVTVYGPAAPPATTAVQISRVISQSAGSGTINQAFTTSNGMQVFAGAREDPFFFDLAQFLKILPDRSAGNTAQGCLPAPLGGGTCTGFNPVATAADSLKGYNVLSIVLELPKSMLTAGGTSKIAYWATTSTPSGL